MAAYWGSAVTRYSRHKSYFRVPCLIVLAHSLDCMVIATLPNSGRVGPLTDATELLFCNLDGRAEVFETAVPTRSVMNGTDAVRYRSRSFPCHLVGPLHVTVRGLRAIGRDLEIESQSVQICQICTNAYCSSLRILFPG